MLHGVKRLDLKICQGATWVHIKKLNGFPCNNFVPHGGDLGVVFKYN